MKLFLILPFFLMVPKVFGQKKSSPQEINWRSRNNHSFLLNWQSTQNAPGDLIQQNRLLYQPQLRTELTYRPDFTYQYRRRFRIVVRPQATLLQTQGRVRNPEEYWITSRGVFNLQDAFIESAPTTEQRLTIGLQTFQWGPAELINASNPFASFRNQTRNPLFLDKGRGLIRWMYTPSMNWNYVLLAEPLNNGEIAIQDGESFGPTALLKIEFSRDSGTSYLGLLSGIEDRNRNFAGLYANATLTDGFALYIDGRVTSRQKSHRPDPEIFLPTLSRVDKPAPTARVLVGARYEGDIDFRLEYFYQQIGYDRSEFLSALTALAFSQSAADTNVSRFLRPGFDLYGISYAFASLRYGGWGPRKDWNLSLRHLRSLTDNSSTNQLVFDRPLGDHTLFVTEASANAGDLTSEFRLLQVTNLWLGLKYTF